MPRRKFDWFGFWVHFVFGLIVGGLIGLYIWGRSDWRLSTSFIPGLCFIGGGSLIGGVVAGFCQEEFWEGLSAARTTMGAITIVGGLLVIALLLTLFALSK